MLGMKYNISLKEILQRPLFNNSTLIAGEGGVNRIVNWVHILQVANIDTLLNGNEMILTTGAGLKKGSEIFFLKNLIQQDASCLCIELGNYFKEISLEMISLANEHNFPLIIFEKTIRFIDVTQEIHSMLINRHHEVLKEFIEVSRQFQQITLSSNATLQILRLLHRKTQSKIAFLPVGEEGICIPPIPSNDQKFLRYLISQQNEDKHSYGIQHTLITIKKKDKYFLINPIGTLSQSLGHIIMVIEKRKPEELDNLILDSASTAIAQDALRKWYLEERKNQTEHLWVDDVVHNRNFVHNQVEKWFPPEFSKQIKTYRVCLFELVFNKNESSINEQSMFQTHLKLIIRNIFKSFGFHLLTTTKDNLIITIIVGLENQKMKKDKIHSILKSEFHKNSSQIKKMNFAVGREYYSLNNIYNSYDEAMSVLKFNENFHNSKRYFYEDLGVYRILLDTNKDSIIKYFIKDTIGELIEYDQMHNGELINTLKALLENDGSKKAAAEQLFIVRQTIYYRLNKIKEFLGEDFMNSDRRLAIELALHAYLFNEN